MIATLVIGLREGLEAALIVGIIAAFLRKNGRSLVPMWIGVASATLLAVVVGVALGALEQALPQSAQEGLETVIGAIAVFFVTTMIVWMNTHARAMRRELEHEAADALGRGGAMALAAMAFLAVLKEGFETSVFLLATFSAAQSAALAATGAVLGVLIAIGIGIGIYAGGVRIDLGRFFRVTGAFLILVAAGLVMSTLRTAHEAGWLVAGQQATLDLSWLVAPGSIQSALITGVLGIPADPRLIEVVGWLCYLIPVALYVYLPRGLRPRGRAARALPFGIAAVLVLAAGALAVVAPTVPAAPTRAAISGGGSVTLAPGGAGSGSVRVTRPGATTTIALRGGGRSTTDQGVAATEYSSTSTEAVPDRPSTVTLSQVIAAAGGRLPVGLSPAQHPGPYTATWTEHRATRVWIADGALLDADSSATTVLVLSGSGLDTSRTVTVDDADSSWRVSDASVARTADELAARSAAADERGLWGVQLPLLLVVAALVCALVGVRRIATERRAAITTSDPVPDPTPRSPLYAQQP